MDKTIRGNKKRALSFNKKDNAFFHPAHKLLQPPLNLRQSPLNPRSTELTPKPEGDLKIVRLL